jgi:hypothetical protein
MNTAIARHTRIRSRVKRHTSPHGVSLLSTRHTHTHQRDYTHAQNEKLEKLCLTVMSVTLAAPAVRELYRKAGRSCSSPCVAVRKSHAVSTHADETMPKQTLWTPTALKHAPRDLTPTKEHEHSNLTKPSVSSNICVHKEYAVLGE